MFRPSKKYPSRDTVPLRKDGGVPISDGADPRTGTCYDFSMTLMCNNLSVTLFVSLLFGIFSVLNSI